MKKIVIVLTLLFFANLKNVAYSVDKNDKEFLFLQSINDLRADYLQETMNGKDTVESSGKIIIKKPDSILLEDNSEKMRIKVVSLNGNIKVIDKDLDQITYLGEKYNNMVSDLMSFFTKNIKPEKIKKNKNNELCIEFKSFDNNMEACLKVDLRKNTIKHIVVYAIVEEVIENKMKKQKTIKKYRTQNILFTKAVINKGVDDKEFFVKDNRIFGDED